MVKLPDSLKEFGFEVEKASGEVDKTVGNNLRILVEQSQKLVSCYQTYAAAEDARMRDYLLEAMGSYLNHIAQAFRDIMTYIMINDTMQDNGRNYEESLGFYVRKYFSLDMERTPNAEQAADFLKKRNDLVHDYFSIDKRNYELASAMETYGEGFIELSVGLRDYCLEHFQEISLEQDIKKAIARTAQKTSKKEGKSR